MGNTLVVASYYDLKKEWHKDSSQVINLLVITFLLFLPEGQVFLKELNDALGVTEVILLELVDLLESILESLISKLTSGLVVFHNFVVEDGEVKGKTKLDWVAWWEGDLIGFFVGFESFLLDILKFS